MGSVAGVLVDACVSELGSNLLAIAQLARIPGDCM